MDNPKNTRNTPQSTRTLQTMRWTMAYVNAFVGISKGLDEGKQINDLKEHQWALNEAKAELTRLGREIPTPDECREIHKKIGDRVTN